MGTKTMAKMCWLTKATLSPLCSCFRFPQVVLLSGFSGFIFLFLFLFLFSFLVLPFVRFVSILFFSFVSVFSPLVFSMFFSVLSPLFLFGWFLYFFFLSVFVLFFSFASVFEEKGVQLESRLALVWKKTMIKV